MVTAREKHVPVVQTAGLCKTFKDFWRRPRVHAVTDLTLTIEPGEVFGLLGPNGSGKSTAIKMLLGLLYPTRGRIAVFGKSPTDVSVKSRIGFLPEESYLYRFLNAHETLDYFGRLFRLPPLVRKKRSDMLLEMVGLEHEAKRRLGEYSKGMARRIGLAQALINDPEFLILDEPTSGLDPIGSRQIKELIRELGRRGKTILLSSHMLADVEDVCDRVTILYGGKQRAAGQISELLSDTNRTQIIAERLSRETLDEVRALIARLENKDILEISSPRNRLEDFFIDIVEEAQRARVATSGVAGAGALPEFLGATPQQVARAVVDSLVSAAANRSESTATPVQPVAVPSRSDGSRELLDALMGASRSASPRPSRDPADEPAPPKRTPVQADAAVLEQLLNPQKPDSSAPPRASS